MPQRSLNGELPLKNRGYTALSYFVRTFRDPPEGGASAPYGAIYGAIGNPPVGSDAIGRQCAEVRQISAGTEPAPVAEPGIVEGVLETLIPSGSAAR